MKTETYQILYCSRNCVQGTVDEMAAQVAKILKSAREANAQAGVTGALLFNTVLFAQVLEGPLDQVEQIFEKIQRDPRHSHLTVLRAGPVPSPSFAEWSMAYAGAVTEQSHPILAVTLQSGLSGTAGAGEEVICLLRRLVLQEENNLLRTR